MFNPILAEWRLIALVVGGAGTVIGLLWLRRVARIEEPPPFRATETPPRDYLPVLGLGAVALLLGTILFLIRQ